ncbi:hypothetical protein CPB84DRAFT_1247761 [Gymnopilus junonius]|uniref:Secreted protein n=1 Tax=Gymnopilus junonius TaxID=109634 RepID=A0A9P5NIQ6_GYMJU|nr:hypothetical protein CPB84DRAFT_1247761 [Gymnopilus junonius]
MLLSLVITGMFSLSRYVAFSQVAEVVKSRTLNSRFTNITRVYCSSYATTDLKYVCDVPKIYRNVPYYPDCKHFPEFSWGLCASRFCTSLPHYTAPWGGLAKGLIFFP